MIVGGSDWPVTSMNPLDAIQVGVTRRGLTRRPRPGVDSRRDCRPRSDAGQLHDQRACREFPGVRETGSIEVGKAADLIVLDRNLFDIPAEEIHRAKVLMTLLEGKEVYRDSGFRRRPGNGPRSRSRVGGTGCRVVGTLICEFRRPRRELTDPECTGSLSETRVGRLTDGGFPIEFAASDDFTDAD